MNIDAIREHAAEQLRLTLLRLLGELPSYRANSTVLMLGAQQMGFDPTRAQVRTQLEWLREQGLVTTAEPTDALVVATLTERGLDVAEGRGKTPGVARPAPKS